MHQKTSDIYLILPTPLNLGVLRHTQDILDHSKISCAMLQTTADTPNDPELLKEFVSLLQKYDVACVIENDHKLAHELKADGVHLSLEIKEQQCEDDDHIISQFIKSYETAREALGQDAIIGFTAHDRHTAMVLGEHGAEYIAFDASKNLENQNETVENIKWWSELFELPCIAWNINDLQSIKLLKEQGSDFLAFGEILWNQDTKPTDILNEIQQQLN